MCTSPGHCLNLRKSSQVVAAAHFVAPPVCPLFRNTIFQLDFFQFAVVFAARDGFIFVESFSNWISHNLHLYLRQWILFTPYFRIYFWNVILTGQGIYDPSHLYRTSSWAAGFASTPSLTHSSSRVPSPALLNFALSRRLLALLLHAQISFHFLSHEPPHVLEGTSAG